MTKDKLTNKKRSETILKLLEKEHLLCTGNLVATRNGEPIITFVYDKERDLEDGGSPEDVFVATPAGVVLYKDNDLYKEALKHTKRVFLQNLDENLKKMNTLLTMSV